MERTSWSRIPKEDLKAQANTAVLTEAPDQSSEEPRAEIVSDFREGKPRT